MNGTEECPEQRYRRIIRWMKDNVLLVSGVYRTKSRSLRVDPGLALDWRGAVLRATHRWPADRDDWRAYPFNRDAPIQERSTNANCVRGHQIVISRVTIGLGMANTG